MKILKDKAPQQPLSRRASLLFGPSGRRKFEILARRFAGAGNGGVGAEEFVLKPPQRPNTLHIVPDTCQSELRPDTEWSTSSFPSSPSGTTKHRDERDAMLVEVEETTLVNPANVEIDFNDGSSAASASPEGSNAPTCEIQRKFSNARLSNVRVGQLSSSNSGPGLAGQAGTGDMENPSEMDPSSSDSGTMARCTVVRPLKIRFCRPSSAGSVKKSSKAKRQVKKKSFLFVLRNNSHSIFFEKIIKIIFSCCHTALLIYIDLSIELEEQRGFINLHIWFYTQKSL